MRGRDSKLATLRFMLGASGLYSATWQKQPHNSRFRCVRSSKARYTETNSWERGLYTLLCQVHHLLLAPSSANGDAHLAVHTKGSGLKNKHDRTCLARMKNANWREGLIVSGHMLKNWSPPSCRISSTKRRRKARKKGSAKKSQEPTQHHHHRQPEETPGLRDPST